MDLPGEVREVEHVPEAFADLVVARSPTSIALCGNVLAHACYRALGAKPLDWTPIEVFFGDERFVPVHSPDSNEGQARRVMLDHVAPRAIHGMYRADPIEEAVKAYDELMQDSLPIELVHLGVGPDGHTASLFPGSAALGETRRLVVSNGDNLHEHPRITFTFPAIARARLVVVTVAGAEKRDVIARIRAGEDLPAARIRAEEVVWLCDHAALG